MKGYVKSLKLHYDKPRRAHVSERLRSKVFKSRASYPFNIKPSTPTAVDVNVADITRFLAKYLSGKQNVAVRPIPYQGSFATEFQLSSKRQPFYDVIVPKWDGYDLPLKGFDKYRIYRSGVWHESCHVRYTPPELFKWQNVVEQDIFNIIEDRRIEDLGVEEWPGYLPERVYTQAYGFALRPKVDQVSDPNLQKIEAFMQRLLVGKIKGNLPSQMDNGKVEETAYHVEKKLEKLKGADELTLVEELRELTREVIRRLGIPFDASTPSKFGSESPWTGTFSEEYAQRYAPSKEELDEDMGEFFDDLERNAKPKPSGKDGEKKSPQEITKDDVEAAREGSVEAKSEYASVQKKQAVDPEIVAFSPTLTHGPVSLYKDQKFITAMNTHLRKWKTGYKELIGESGARLSVPDYVRHKEEPFATRIKQSARGKKVLVIADFSGSMKPKEDDYKRAIVSSMEVLGGIGSNIALFTFAGDPSQGVGFFKIKSFEEPKWTSAHSAKVAGLGADYHSTPTHKIYENLEGYIRKHSPPVTITITDGIPDDTIETSKQIKHLRRHTRMVAFGIADGNSRKVPMEQSLKMQGYNKSFVVTDVYEIPPKLVKLIAPE